MARSNRALRHRDDLRADDLLRLADACEIVFCGVLTPAALRREAARGNLTIERIAGKDFVTPAALAEMRERCKVKAPKVAASSLGGAPDGSARAARRGKLAALREKLENTKVPKHS